MNKKRVEFLFICCFTEKETQKGKMKNTTVQKRKSCENVKSKRCENVKYKRCENVKKINAAFENPKKLNVILNMARFLLLLL